MTLEEKADRIVRKCFPIHGAIPNDLLDRLRKEIAEAIREAVHETEQTLKPYLDEDHEGL